MGVPLAGLEGGRRNTALMLTRDSANSYSPPGTTSFLLCLVVVGRITRRAPAMCHDPTSEKGAMWTSITPCPSISSVTMEGATNSASAARSPVLANSSASL